jgi:hypothetical protein
MAKSYGGFIGSYGLKAPNTPTLTGAGGGDGYIDIGFTPPEDREATADNVLRYVGNGGGTTSTPTDVNSGQVTISSLSNGTSYNVSVSAVNAFGFSGASDSESASATSTTGTYGFIVGGREDGTVYGQNAIQYITVKSLGDSLDWGDLAVNMAGCACSGSATRALSFSHSQVLADYNTINYWSTASTGNASDFGNLQQAFHSGAAVSNSTRACYAGGTHYANGNTNAIQYVTIASTGNASDFGDLTSKAAYQASGATSSTRGLYVNGNRDDVNYRRVDYITIASTGNATNWGDTEEMGLTNPAAGSNGVKAAVFGGYDTGSTYPSGKSTRMNVMTIATTGSAADFGDLVKGVYSTTGVTDGPSGRVIICGGNDTDGGYSTFIQYSNVNTGGGSAEFGELFSGRQEVGGTSDCHGGLQ